MTPAAVSREALSAESRTQASTARAEAGTKLANRNVVSCSVHASKTGNEDMIPNTAAASGTSAKTVV